MFQDSKVDTKKEQKKTALNHTDTMLNFLHRATIDANASFISINMGKINDVLINGWFTEKQNTIVLFKDTKCILEKAPCPISNQY